MLTTAYSIQNPAVTFDF